MKTLPHRLAQLCAAFMLLFAAAAQAANFTVNSTVHGPDADGATTTLVEAIQQANAAGAGPHTINLPATTIFLSDDIVFTDGASAGRTMYPAITTNITILGNGSTLDATGKNARFFYVSGSGALTLEQINLVGGKAQGGNGSGGNFAGGGGGAGMGGAIFVNGTTASLTMRRSSIVNSVAQGGTGTISVVLAGPGGGGGGMGGNGADSGGGGPRSAAAGNTGGDGVGGTGGANNGGFGGGGGGGIQPGNAGNGGFGGGGGGGWTNTGVWGNPGAGGFGGGGGGITSAFAGPGGTAGAFGGVGGNYNSGGFAAGGGGAGLGGGIFNYQGTVTLENVTLTTNSAIGGNGQPLNGVGAGSGAGGAIFNYDGSVSMKHVTASGNIVQTGVDNPGVATGGALYNYDAAGGATPSVTLFNTILANSTYTSASGVEVVNSGGTVTASGAASTNLIETSSGTITGTVLTVDPALGLAARSGGIIGIFPSAGSPVLNVGDNANSLATDTFGTARPQGGTVDIGAVEGAAPSTFTLTSGTLLISEATLRAIIAVNPTTGARTLLSKSGVVGTGVGFLNPQGIAASATQDIYVVDSSLDAVIKVDATNGNRTLISIGADDATANSVNGGAAVGTGPSFQTPTGIAIRADGKLLVTDSGATASVFSDAVFLVDPATGNRSILSDDTVPDAVNAMTTPNGIIVHSTLGIVVADNATTDAILKVNGTTGARTVLSSGTVPDAVNPFTNPTALAEDTDGSLLLVENTSPNRLLLRINQTTGARTVVSTLSTTLNFSGVAAGTSGIFVTSTTTPDSVYQVNPTTGVATVLSNNNVGDGVLLSNNLNIGLAMIPAGTAVAPTVSTATQSAVTATSATLGGNVTSDGGAGVTDRGIVWSTSANPTTADTKVANGTGTGAFSATVTGLPANSTVHVRAYAINSVNTSYGADISFITPNNNANLSALTTTASGLAPGFGVNTIVYTAGVSNATTSTTVTATRQDANATLQVRVNGGGFSALTSGVASGNLALNVGANPIDVKVTAQDGTTTKTYTITVTRAAPPAVTSSTANNPVNSTTIVINGTGFDTTPGNNTVTFNNGATGHVTAATATQLTVTFDTMPTGLGSLTAIVTNGNGNSGAAVQVATVTVPSGAVFYNVTGTVDNTNAVPTGGLGTAGSPLQMVSLRGAVLAANANGAGPHTITVPSGTYNLSVNNPNTPGTSATVTNPDLQVGSHLSTVTIVGTGLTKPKIVQTNQTNTFYSTTGNDVITTGFKGDLTPAIVNLTLDNLEITGGGLTGIFTGADDGTNRSSTTIKNCNIHHNTNADPAVGQGGAIYNQGGSLTVQNTTFANNTATHATAGQGGAIFYNLPNSSGQGSQGDLTITGCTFTSNSAAAAGEGGGAMFVSVVSAGNPITITGNNFVNNAASGGNGGALALLNSARTTNVNFNRFIGHTAGGTGIVASANSSTVNANQNWWGTNNAPVANDFTGSAKTLTNRLQLALTPTAPSILTGGSTLLTASFLTDSASNAVSASNLGALIGQPVSFAAGTRGTIHAGADTTIQATGTAAATFDAGSVAGVSATTALVDNAPAATANVNVAPTVTLTTGILPVSATSVIITGTGFDTTALNNTVVFTNGTAGAVTAATNTQLTVNVSGLVGGTNLLAVVTTNGVGSGAAVQVATVPLLSITPNTANLAANAPTLIIGGSGFSTTAANNTVTLSSGTATVTAATATQLTCTLGGTPTVGALTATVSVVGNGSTGPTQVATIVPAPTVTSNTANRAINAPTIVIAGTNFDTTAGNNTVAFNLGAVGTVTTATATSLTVTFSTPPSTTGALTANVTVAGGSSGATQVATIVPAPTVTLNTANRAINAPTIVIAGTNFNTTAGNNTVAFNLGAVGTVTTATATSLTVTFSTPPSTTGALTANVTVAGGSSGATQVATIVPAPTVTSNTANRAINAPTIVIAGTNFDTTAGNNTVAFNLGAVGTVTSATATSLTVTFSTPPSTTGSLTANVTVAGGSSGATQVATIVPAPTVISNTTNRAINAPTIVIAGTNFDTTAGNNTVAFNLGAVGTVTTATATSLTVTFSTPPSTTGSLTAVVTTDGGDSGAAVQVATIVPAPTVTLNTANLPIDAPTITIAGTNFSATALDNTVAFNLGAVGTVTSATATSLTVTFSTPPSTTGSLTAVVTVFGGTSGAATQVANIVPPVAYTVATTGNAIVVTDILNGSDTLAVSEPSPGNIQFDVAGKTFNVDGTTLIVGNSGALSLTNVTAITVNAAGGDDTINVGAFTVSVPSLTINGGTGNDTVNLNGSITFAADANLDLDLQNDNATPGTDIVNVAANAKILASGAGSITVKVSRNIAFAAGSSFETVNGGITLEANANGAAAGNFTGIDLAGGSLKSSGTGNISLEAQGGDDAATGSHIGILLPTTAKIQSTGTGGITLKGTGGTGTDSNFGVILNGATVEVASSSGPIGVTGTGGAGSGSFNSGIAVRSGAKITATGSAAITLTGTGGTGAGSIRGVEVENSVQISTVDGNMLVTGIGGVAATGGVGTGVAILTGPTISSSGTGTVTLDGTGGGGTAFTAGVIVHGFGTPTLVTSASGNIVLRGKANATTTGTSNIGVWVDGLAQVKSTGTGANAATITLDGTGGGGTDGNSGVLVNGVAGALSSVDGAINIKGVAGAGGVANGSFGAIIATTGSIGITGVANLDISADTQSIATGSTIISVGTNTVTLRPVTFGQPISVGGADSGSTLGLTDAELDSITAATVKIGDANSGLITVSAVISPLNYKTLVLARDTTFTATGGFTSDIGPLAANIESITVTGALTINPAATLTIAATGGFVPTTGQSFKIIDNDSTDAIGGTFALLPEQQALPNFLGSTVNARITYVGGSGNDVVIIANTPPNATPVFAARGPAGSVKIPVSQILAAALDPDAGDTVKLVSVGTPTAPAHGTATYTGNGSTGFVFYTPTAGDTNPDTFSYTVTDNHGAQSTSVVNIAITGSTGAVASQITSQTRAANGTVSLTFAGVPGYTVGVQFTTDLTAPQTWVNLGPLTMNGVGQATITDSAHPLPGFPNIFYRLIYPAP